MAIRYCHVFVTFSALFIGVLLIIIAKSASATEVNVDSGVTKYLFKREILRRITSCPEECTCEVYENSGKLVDCFNTRKTDIPQDIPGDVVTLNMSRNLIRTVKAGLLDNLRDIEVLDLSHNNVQEIQPSALKDLTAMRYLDLSYNDIKNISLDDLRQSALNLETLKISSTKIREVPELYDISGLYMKKLTHLSMAKNFFSSIPPGYMPPTLQFLDISCLNMRKLKNTALTGLDSLQEVVLRGCKEAKGRLKGIEHNAFATSVELKRLDLARNELTAVPTGLPVSLEFLDLSKNKISTIKKMECATEVDMQSRLYVNADGTYDQYGDGRLARPVGSALSVLANLRELRLVGNPIASLCMDEFVLMEKLEVLNMSECKLSSFHPHTFLYPSNLVSLDLRENQLMHFKTEALPMLEELYLQLNVLENADLSHRKVPSLRKADLSGNPWRCNCEIKPLLQLLGYHSNEIKFVDLHAFSARYSCAVPLKTKGKPLLTLDMDQVVCEEETGINVWAIAAPASLGVIIILIIIVIVVSFRRDSIKRARLRAERGMVDDGEEGCCLCCHSCCCCCKSKNNYSRTRQDTRRNFDYPSDTLVRKNALLDDAAVLCNAKDQKWVINKMIPEVHRYRSDGYQSSGDKQLDMPSRKLHMNVFTIGQSIKIERLSKCIDSNRKIVLIVTHNFVDEDSCILVLNVIRERMVRDPKDSVILLIMDAIAWSTMPQCLQFLMVEKTFVQFPQDSRGRQEFYFWDSVCSNMYSNSLRQLLPPLKEEGDNPAFDDAADDTKSRFPVTEPPYPIFGEDETPPMRPDGWYTGGRRMKGLSGNNGYMSPGREAKLKRLGLQKDGHLMHDVLGGIDEAKNLGREQKRNIDTVYNSQSTNLPMKHIDSTRSHKEDIASVHRDIDDLYSTRAATSIPRANYSARMRSLLPANAGDADSIYSEDEEIATQMIRAPERQRSFPIVKTSRLHSPSANSTADQYPPGEFRETLQSRTSTDQLHGTDKTFNAPNSDHVGPIMESPEPVPTMEEEEEEERSSEEEKSKKNKKKKSKKSKKKTKKK